MTTTAATTCNVHLSSQFLYSYFGLGWVSEEFNFGATVWSRNLPFSLTLTFYAERFSAKW